MAKRHHTWDLVKAGTILIRTFLKHEYANCTFPFCHHRPCQVQERQVQLAVAPSTIGMVDVNQLEEGTCDSKSLLLLWLQTGEMGATWRRKSG